MSARDKVLLHHRRPEQGELFAEVLRRAGHDVTLVHTIDEAMRALSAQDVGVVICNFHGSQECIRLMLKVKHTCPDVGRLVLVKEPDRDFARQALETNLVHHFVSLPTSKETLTDTVTELRDWARRRAEPQPPWGFEPEVTPIPA